MKGIISNPSKTFKTARKFTSKDASRPILGCVHLDGNGDAVATDSYRMLVKHGAYDGESIDVPAELVQKLAKLPASVKSCKIEDDGYTVVARYGGCELKASAEFGKFPNYKALSKQEKTVAVAHVLTKQLIPLLKEYKKTNSNAVLVVRNRDLYVCGSDTDSVKARFEKWCDGGSAEIGFNPSYLRDALEACGNEAELHFESPIRPLIARNGEVEVIVMPVRVDEKAVEKAAKKFKTAPKSPEPAIDGEVGSLKGQRVCITGTLAGMTRSEAFTRLELAGATPCENLNKSVTLMVIAKNAGASKLGKLEKAIEKGQKIRVVNGTEFEKALKEQGKTAGEKAIAKAAKKPELPKTEIKVTRAAIIPTADGIKTTVIDEHVETVEAKSEVVEAAAEVTLATMRERFADRPNVAVTQKRSDSPIWVEGETKPLHDELVELGFRWARKRSAWYYRVA